MRQSLPQNIIGNGKIQFGELFAMRADFLLPVELCVIISPWVMVAGGLVGGNGTSAGTPTIENCYASVNVCATATYIGGFVGTCQLGSISGYWNTDAVITGVGYLIGGTNNSVGKSEVEMKSSTFATTLNANRGSDSSLSEWTQAAGVNGGFPTLVPTSSGGDTIISIAAIGGVTAPVARATPVTAAITETAQSGTFANSTAYTATITLAPETGFTLTGVAANFFAVAGVTSVSNSADSGVVTAVLTRGRYG